MTDVLWLRTHGTNARLIDSVFATTDASELSWEACRDVFDSAQGPYSYGLPEGLARLGWSVVDLVLDLAQVREAWVREHGPLPPARTDREALALAAIERYRPAIVVDLNMKTFDREGLRRMRAAAPFVRATVGIATGLKRLEMAALHDIVLVPGRRWAARLREVRSSRAAGPFVFHHAFEPSRHAVAQGGTSRPSLGPVMSCRVGGGDYAERTRLTERLLEAGLIRAWLQEVPDRALETQESGRARPRASQSFLDRIPLPVLGALVRDAGRGGGTLNRRLWEELVRTESSAGAPTGSSRSPGSLAERFPDRVHPAVHGRAMYEVVASASAVVHHGVGAASSLRHFEVTGAGAALVTNHFEGIEELFDVGNEILTYRSLDEAVATVRELIADDGLARQVADAGHRRTITDHTVAARARQLADILYRFDDERYV